MGRRRPRAPEMTSLLDVLFIVSFAALVQAAAHGDARSARKAADIAADAGAVDAGTLDAGAPVATVAAPEAAARLVEAIDAQSVVLVVVSADGRLTSLAPRPGGTAASAPVPLSVPLLRASDDPQVAIEYRANNATEERLCQLVRRYLDATPDLGRALIVVAADQPLAELPYALVRGLQADVARCMEDANGYAILVDPGRAGGSEVP